MAFDIRVHFHFENEESSLLGGIIPTVLSDSLAGLWPGMCVKYFLSFPEKNLSPEKTETN